MLRSILGLFSKRRSQGVAIMAEPGGGYGFQSFEDDPSGDVTLRDPDDHWQVNGRAAVDALRRAKFFTGDPRPARGMTREESVMVTVLCPRPGDVPDPEEVERSAGEAARLFLREVEKGSSSWNAGPFEVSVSGSATLRAAWFRRTFPRVGGQLDALARLNEGIDEAHLPIVEEFKELLKSLEKENFGSLEANQRIASLVQDTANRLQVAFLCPRCNEPARFKCVPDGTVKTGVFTFGHARGNHTATTKIPPLTLTKPAPDRRRTQSAE